MKIASIIKKLILPMIVVGGVGSYFYFQPEEVVEYVTESVEVGDVEQVVSVNGTVESKAKIGLSFLRPGKIESLNFEVGENVNEDDVLASLENRALQIRVDQALATLNIAQAELNLLYAGPTYSEIRIAELRIQEAETNLRHAIDKLQDLIVSNDEKVKIAELEIDNAQVALENAQARLENRTESGDNAKDQAEDALQQAYEDSKTVVIDSLNSVEANLLFADSILGIDNEDLNDDFEDVLEGTRFSAKRTADSSYIALRDKFELINESFDLAESTWTNDEARNLIGEVDMLILDAQSLMDDVNAVLDVAIDYLSDDNVSGISAGVSVTVEDMNSFKSSVVAEKISLTQQLSLVRDIKQTIDTAGFNVVSTDLSSMTETVDAEANLKNAEVALEIAELSLEDAKVQSEISENDSRREIDLANLNLEKARADYEDLISDPRYVDVAAQQSRVARENASYAEALNNLEETKLISPVFGLVTEVNAELGENVNTEEHVYVIITDKLQIKVNISETDINKVKVGNKVDITLDSLPLTEVFEGTVLSINPAETVVQGVIYYETTILFDQEDPRIMPGMTADLDILTESKEDVLTISPLSVEYDDDQTFVYVLENGQRVEKNVTLGIEGENVFEVLEGLNEGDEVIIYESNGSD